MRTLTLVTAALAAAGPARAADPPAKPNVLLVMADDLNNHLGCYGHPAVKTPNVDKLAAKGVRFDRAYCQFPLCNPSRVSLLSGLRPEATGVLDNTATPREKLPDHVFLPQLFRAAGYFTGRAGKVFHGSPGFDVPACWDVVEEGNAPADRKTLVDKKEYEFLKGAAPGGGHWTGRLTADDADTGDGKVARTAAGWVEKAVKDGKPFFVAAGFRKPHLPWFAPKKYFDLYPPDKVPLPPGPRTAKAPAEAEWKEAVAAYYACVSYADAQLGVLLDTLDKHKLWDNTVVVFLGDHGYHLGEHGRWAKMSLYENSTRAPLVVYAPGAAGNGQACPRVVEFVDLYPTLAAACGLTPPKGLEGVSLKPLLADPAAAWDRPALTVKVPLKGGKLTRSVVTERYRYIDDNGEKLFDLKADPHEAKNLIDDSAHKAAADELRKLARPPAGGKKE